MPASKLAPHANKLPTWNTTSAATYASAVMYTNVNAGHAHERVSRRITASVEAHWQHRAKNTISDSATGIVNSGRSDPSSHLASRSLAPSFFVASASLLSTLPS